MDFGNYVGMVMIDLHKALDTVDHSILENRLKAIDLDEYAIAWFDAYLTNRIQVADVGGFFLTPGLFFVEYHRDQSWGRPLLFFI